MSPEAHKTILCAIRTVGLVALVGITWLGARYVGWTYTDTQAVLGIINNYFPETVALVLFTLLGVAIYRASAADNQFNFIHFFVSSKAHTEDVSKFIFFLLGVTAVWVIFTLTWRNKLDAGILGVILTVFVVERGLNIGGKVLGKSRPPDKPEGEDK